MNRLVIARKPTARQFLKIPAIMIALISIVTFTPPAPAIAQGTSVTDWIAESKSEVWGQYPEVDQAWPEFPAPTVYVEPDLVNRSTRAIAAEIKPVSQPIVAKVVEVKPVVQQPVVVAAPTPAPAATGDTWIDEILRLTNKARAGEGINTLSLNGTLNQAAARRTSELPASPSPHLRPNGDPFYTVLAEFDLVASKCGENFAILPLTNFTPAQVVDAWMNSPTHRKNIMNGAYTEIGIGHAAIGEKVYVEQLFFN